MAEQKQRIEWIDIAKGIGIIAVLIGHTNSGILRDEIYSFHIPLFIFLSGMLFNGGTKTAKDFFSVQNEPQKAYPIMVSRSPLRGSAIQARSHR